MTPVEALRLAWAALTVLGLGGMLWHLRVTGAAWQLWRWAEGQLLTWDDREAVRGRVRNSCYRLAVKSLLTLFAAACWAIFTDHPVARGWTLVWIATALFGAAMVLLTIWSIHAYRAAHAHRPPHGWQHPPP